MVKLYLAYRLCSPIDAVMAESIRARTQKLQRDIWESIAFYPTLISAGLGVASGVVLLVEGKTPLLHVSGIDNARQLLSVLIGGVISLMVFSFSTVMLVLSQASSQFSPRVLPGLISRQSHQIILGIELGTVIFSLLVLLSLPDSGPVPQAGVLISVALGLVCLVLFVVFIHSVSRSIQVQHVLDDRMSAGLHALSVATEQEVHAIMPETTHWPVLSSPASGYLLSRGGPQLLARCKENDLFIEQLHRPGDFVLAGTPLLKVSEALSSSQSAKILSTYSFSATVPPPEGVLRSLRDITEIALRALSPGTNDPNSAINALDFLTLLLSEWMDTLPRGGLSWEGTTRVFFAPLPLDHLLYRHLAPIATYGQADGMVMGKLLDCLCALTQAHSEPRHLEPITRSARLIRDLAADSLRGEDVLCRFDEALARLSELLGCTLDPIADR
jgi:uncharacterized membrane protein